MKVDSLIKKKVVTKRSSEKTKDVWIKHKQLEPVDMNTRGDFSFFGTRGMTHDPAGPSCREKAGLTLQLAVRKQYHRASFCIYDVVIDCLLVQTQVVDL